ncbi:MAG: 1-acyl-sn-glycerol-3-phosphate acyltransferase [Mycoplasma sp.]|nr:1-acyl-sn-glycerol-3-phosphate acyltransferase [Mycoplasma sp.]
MIKLKIWWASRRAKKYWKHSFREHTKYTLQFRNDFIVKKIKSLMKSLKIEVEVKGYENLGNSGPCFLYGNHQDNFDALAIMYALRAQTEAKDDFNKIATFIAKHSLQYKSYTRYPLNCIDTFYLERDNVRKSLETFEKYGKFVKENKTYGVIFPEGTRNREGTIGEFKPGSFKVAIKEYVPIVPFTINNSVGAFDLKRKETLKIEVIFHKKIQPNSFSTQSTIGLSERVRNIVVSSFKKPSYDFVPSKTDLEDIENSKSAIKWKRNESKKLENEAKKERKKRQQEQRIMDNQAKQDKKYEQQMIKKENKKNKK